MEAGQQVRQPDRPRRRHGAERDLAADQPGQLVDGLVHAPHRRERGPGVGQRGRADVGEPHRAAGAVQQLLPQLPLEAPDLGAHPGLGDVQPLRRAREVAFLRDGDEVRELVQFHKH